MIMMRRHGESWHVSPLRRYAHLLVFALTLLAIALFAWSMRPASTGNAVMRVALDRVPEERVVEFGHENAARRMVMSTAENADPATPQSMMDGRPGRVAQREEPGELARGNTPVRTLKPDRNGILPIGYSLAEGVSSQEGGVGVAKTIAAEDGTATGLTIFLIGGSLIEVDRGELVNALAQIGASDKAGKLPAPGESGRISLERVRMAGLNLRYDAINDRLILKP